MKYVPNRAPFCQYTPDTSTPKVRSVCDTCCPKALSGRRDHHATFLPNRASPIARLLSAPPTLMSSLSARSSRMWPGVDSRHMVSPIVMRSYSVAPEDVVRATFLSHLLQNIFCY